MTFIFPWFSKKGRKQSDADKRRLQKKTLARRLRLESLESRELLAVWTVNVPTVTDVGYVDVTNHTGDLRGILTANELADGDTVVFDDAVFNTGSDHYLHFQTPDLENRSINITKSITIDGGIDTDNDGANDARVNIITENPDTTILIPDNRTSLFLIDDGVIGTNSQVTILDLDITGFDNSAIITSEELEYTNGKIASCATYNANGGAICCLTDEELTIDNVSFDGNNAYSDGTFGGNGGAIYSSFFSIKNSLFQWGAASVDGGAIYRADSIHFCSIETSRFLNNKAGTGGNGQGGAIANTGTGYIKLISTTAAQLTDDFITEPGMVFKENLVVGDQIDKGCGGAIYNSGTIQLAMSGTSSNADEYYFLFIGNEAIRSVGATSGSGNGGAIYNVGKIQSLQSSATETSTFEFFCANNKADGDGGAIYNTKSLELLKSAFESNEAGQNGGAIYSVLGDASYLDNMPYLGNTPYLTEIAPFSRFNNNVSPNGDGGAIFFDFADSQMGPVDIDLENCTFTENGAQYYGGAIVVANQSISLSLVNCHFDFNVATVGGAISSSTTNLSIVDSSFGSNRADGLRFGLPSGVVGQGGALYCLGVIITRGIFSNNFALVDGGAIYANGVDVQNSTFEGNIADLDGGAIFSVNGANLNDTLFQFNRAKRHGGAVYSEEMLVIDSSRFKANIAGTGIQATANGRMNFNEFEEKYELPAYTSDEGAGNIGATNTGSYAAGSYDVAATNTNGGAIACRGTTTITGTDFLDNVAGNGGAIFNSGFLTIRDDSSFERNIAGKYGGAISSVADLLGDQMYNLTIEKNNGSAAQVSANFIGNIALGYGGAIGNWANATISDATFYNNAARQSGGAVSNGYAPNTTENAMIMTNIVIGDVTNGGNSALYGGGVMNGGNLTLNNVVIEGNSSELNGGGLSVTNNGETTGGNVVFNDTNVIRNNTAKHWAGGLLASQYTTLTNNGNVYVDENTATEHPESDEVYLYVSVTGTPFVYGPAASSSSQEETFAITSAAPIGVVDLSDVVSPKSIQEGCSTTLNAIGMDGAVYAYDTNGDGIVDFETTRFLTADALGLSVGVHEVKTSIYQDGNLVDTLNVSVEILDVDPTISVIADEFADGNILSLNLNVANDRAIKRWTLNWGDGTRESFDSLGFALKALHYYESAETQKVYDVLLSVTDVEGFGAEKVYVLKQHVVEGVPAPVFNVVTDSVETETESEEPQTAKSTAFVFVVSNDSNRGDVLSKSTFEETSEREVKRDIFASEEFYSEGVNGDKFVADELAKNVWTQFQYKNQKKNDRADDQIWQEQFDNLLEINM